MKEIPVKTVILTLDEEWYEAICRVLSYVESGEIVQWDAVIEHTITVEEEL